MKKLAIAIAAALTLPAVAQTYYTPDREYRAPEYRTAEERQDWRNNSDRDPYRDGRYRGNTARVIESRPLYAQGEARQECWNQRAGTYETLREPQHDSVLNKGTALGALVGGVVGHQVSNGTGGTVGGALLGGLAGNYINRRNNDDDQPDLDKSRCRVVGADSGNVSAYDVRYTWQGREYVARMDHDPGRYIEIGRDVRADGTPF